MKTQWIGKPSPKSLHKGTGWFGELNKVWVDQVGGYVAMSREVETEWGTIEHVCIRNADNTDIPWREKQRIKNELFGTDRTAIEVFPTSNELVDEANMYHIWVMPKGFKMPFTLNTLEG